MKRPRSSPPKNAPLGTVWLGGPLGWFSAALHVTSPMLLPEEVTRLFGIEPTESQTKDVPILRPDGTVKRVPKFGRWSTILTPATSDEWDLNEVVSELLRRLPQDSEVWERVATLGDLQISLGLELAGSNQEFVLEPGLLRLLGERQIQVYFDVYREDGA